MIDKSGGRARVEFVKTHTDLTDNTDSEVASAEVPPRAHAASTSTPRPSLLPPLTHPPRRPRSPTTKRTSERVVSICFLHDCHIQTPLLPALHHVCVCTRTVAAG